MDLFVIVITVNLKPASNCGLVCKRVSNVYLAESGRVDRHEFDRTLLTVTGRSLCLLTMLLTVAGRSLCLQVNTSSM